MGLAKRSLGLAAGARLVWEWGAKAPPAMAFSERVLTPPAFMAFPRLTTVFVAKALVGEVSMGLAKRSLGLAAGARLVWEWGAKAPPAMAYLAPVKVELPCMGKAAGSLASL